MGWKIILCYSGFYPYLNHVHLRMRAVTPNPNHHKSQRYFWCLYIDRHLGYERVYLPLHEVADTPFHIQGDDMPASHWAASVRWKICVCKIMHTDNNDVLQVRHCTDNLLLTVFLRTGSAQWYVGILWNSMTLTSFVFPELAYTMKNGGGILYRPKLVFIEWHHWVSQNEVRGRGLI